MLLTAAAKCSRGLVVAGGGRRYVRSVAAASFSSPSSRPSSSVWTPPLRDDDHPLRRTTSTVALLDAGAAAAANGPADPSVLPPMQYRRRGRHPDRDRAGRLRRYYSSHSSSRPIPDAAIREGVVLNDADDTDEEAEALASLPPASKRRLSERRSAYRRLVTQVGDSHPDAVGALSSLGDAYWECGLLKSAQESHESVLTHLFQLHGSDEEGTGIGWVDHPSVASTLHKLGSVHARAGDGDEAMRWYERALEMKRALAGAARKERSVEAETSGESEEAAEMYDQYLVEIGTTLNGMAMLHAESGGRDEAALETFLEAERVTRSATLSAPSEEDVETGEDEELDVMPHPNVASICENAAALHVRAAKDYRSALSHLEEAVQIVRHHDGENLERLAGLTMNVGDCHYGLGRHGEAADSFEEALDLLRAARAAEAADVADADADADGGEEGQDEVHPMEAVLRHNLGLTCGNLGKLDEALEHYEKSWELKKRLLGEEHPECASTLNCMGAVYGTKGKRDKALSHFREALRIYRICLREEGGGGVEDEDSDPNVVNTKRNIALVEASNLQ